MHSDYRSYAAALLRTARKSKDPLVKELLRIHILAKKENAIKSRSGRDKPMAQNGKIKTFRLIESDRYYEYYY